jgi:hypothetical protein
MKRRFFFALGVLFLAPAGFAVVDTNTNGLSDLWENRYNNGDLFPETFDSQADPDSDGWTNAQEAAAGTDPFDPNPPDGLLRLQITHTAAVWGDADEDGNPDIITPATLTITWPTIVGKLYTLFLSPDLSAGSWITVGEPFIGTGNINEHKFLLPTSDKLFWRVSVTDTDSDGDLLTNAEEAVLGTNPESPDSDGDGVSDADEIAQGTDAKSAASFSLAWRRVERNLNYDFNPPNNTGTLALNATWNSSLNTSESLTSPIAFTALKDRLMSITFPSSPPDGAFTNLAPAVGNGAISNSASTRNAALSHQRVWLARGPATPYTLEKKVAVFTDRTLNDVKQPPVFSLETFTLPANQTVSNPIDLEEGFISDGPASGSNPPPGSGNITIPAGHLEAFSKQLVPIQIDDDQFATGVDNISITAAISDLGYQDKFWIMAPAGNDLAGDPCLNAMEFKIPFEPTVEMKIVPPAANPTATPNPATLTLSGACPCEWHGGGETSADLTMVWKLGLAGPPAGTKVDVDLPIGVKVMKRRTVKVAVHPVSSVVPGKPNNPPNLLPSKPQIEEELNKVFGLQANAYFDVTILPQEDTQFDIADSNTFGDLTFASGTTLPVPGDGVLCFTDWNSGEIALLTANRPANYDINVYVFGGATPIVSYKRSEEDPLKLVNNTQDIGKANIAPGENYCIVDGDRDARTYDLDRNPTGYLMTQELRSLPSVLHTIAHEIGHIILLGGGHPDEEQGDAPLKGTDRTKRLMCSGPRWSITKSKLLVKMEWDKAEEWLIEVPDKRIRIANGLDENEPTGNY